MLFVKRVSELEAKCGFEKEVLDQLRSMSAVEQIKKGTRKS